ncbi:MAG TPA: D-alanyl-D-alanine carboxypeptidase, partial [Chitinophagaceae bacterium]|nr:D-alanyl-D-alanine carboxypeptidase [Chitinophagaceae bacterium]
ILLFLVSCAAPSRLVRKEFRRLENDTLLRRAHVGISVLDGATGRYLYQYQSGKYFVPASNIKIATCYAALKYLGDSLPAARFTRYEGALTIIPAGDPTFLHPAFPQQPLWDFLSRHAGAVQLELGDGPVPYGRGWTWEDFDQSYMPERSAFPLGGNAVWFRSLADTAAHPRSLSGQDTIVVADDSLLLVEPSFFGSRVYVSTGTTFRRNRSANSFYLDTADLRNLSAPGRRLAIPYITENGHTARQALEAVLQKPVPFRGYRRPATDTVLYSRPLDSVLRPMMHQSDNFLAEQLLLMAGHEVHGNWNEATVISSLLRSDLADLPQKPRWVDGSGLSRYNLFTPDDFVALLQKMKNEFGMERLKGIFPGPGEGTLKNNYAALQGRLYAKTGTLSGVVALSGYLYTKENRLLLFSVLVNNHQGSATDIRKAVERVLSAIQ